MDRESPVAWRELSNTECFDLLAGQQLGRLAVVDDLGPMVFPASFVLDRHMVVFRTGEGTKLATAVGRREALSKMFGRYLELADTGLPVHSWPGGVT